MGGQGIYLSALAAALKDLGHHVEVVSGPPFPALRSDIPLHRLASLDLFTHDNALAAFRPSFLRTPGHLSEWLLHNTGAFGEPLAFSQRLVRWFAQHGARFDVVHDNQGLGGAMATLARRVPVVTTLHHPITVDLEQALSLEPRHWKRTLLRRWHGFVTTQAKVARQLPAVVTVSEASRARIARDFGVEPARMQVIPNGIDHDVFFPTAQTRREEALIVATASSDLPLKGVDVLIAAFCELARARPDVSLALVGRLREGPVRAAIEQAGLGPRIRVVSGLTHQELADYYRRATLVAVPSRFEGFGFPAAEAMACGAPVVATTGGALPEVVGDAGWVVPAGDAEALTEGMAMLLDKPDLRARLSVLGAERARTHFTWSGHARAVSAVYEAVLDHC